MEDTATFHNYGFLPELIGRFTRIIPFTPLDGPTLKRILVEQVIPARRQELRLAGIRLVVEDAVLEKLVQRAIKKEIGARGLASSLTRHLEDASFEAYSEKGLSRVVLHLDGDHVKTEME